MLFKLMIIKKIIIIFLIFIYYGKNRKFNVSCNLFNYILIMSNNLQNNYFKNIFNILHYFINI